MAGGLDAETQFVATGEFHHFDDVVGILDCRDVLRDPRPTDGRERGRVRALESEAAFELLTE